MLSPRTTASSAAPNSFFARPAGLLVLLLSGLCGATNAQQTPREEPAPAANDRAFLGLQTEDVGEPAGAVKVVYVFPHSAAEAMGFRIGDRVVALNDVLIESRDSFSREVGNNNIDGTLRFLVERAGETIKIQGKIGSFRKTMTAYQEDLRKEIADKPLAPPPAAIWWDPERKEWDEKANRSASTREKLAVVFSIDDCSFCVGRKLPKMTQMQEILAKTSPEAPVAFTGYFYFEGKRREEAQEAAAAVLQAHAVRFPIAIAYYPDGVESDRRKQALLHHHGVAIVDRAGRVKFLQIFGEPGQEFFAAYQKGLAELQTESAPAQETPGEGKAGSGEQGR